MVSLVAGLIVGLLAVGLVVLLIRQGKGGEPEEKDDGNHVSYCLVDRLSSNMSSDIPPELVGIHGWKETVPLTNLGIIMGRDDPDGAAESAERRTCRSFTWQGAAYRDNTPTSR